METVVISKEEYSNLREKANLDEELLIKLIRGLEDIRMGRVKSWEKVKTH